MAELTEAEKERIIEQCLDPVRRHLRRAMGGSGFGTVLIEFKGWKPKIESNNTEREIVDVDPQG